MAARSVCVECVWRGHSCRSAVQGAWARTPAGAQCCCWRVWSGALQRARASTASALDTSSRSQRSLQPAAKLAPPPAASRTLSCPLARQLRSGACSSSASSSCTSSCTCCHAPRNSDLRGRPRRGSGQRVLHVDSKHEEDSSTCPNITASSSSAAQRDPAAPAKHSPPPPFVAPAASSPGPHLT